MAAVSPRRRSWSAHPPGQGGLMDIGKPKRIYTIEPIEDPIPREQPEKVAEPAPPEPAPRERVRVPARA